MIIHPRFLAKAIKQWEAQDALSKFVIVGSLLLVFFAYLPTLQFDYVTQDQWRAFRYPAQEQTAYDRAKACTQTTWKFYVQTGRPLVWIGECVEHAAVARISDFIYMRPIVLSIALLTVMYLGVALAPITGSLSMGVLAASAFLMAPGYSFMYLQGMTAGIVLVAIILAAVSFSLLRKWLDQSVIAQDFKITKLWAPFFLFVSSCLIYPAWAFLVVPLAWMAFGIDDKNSWTNRLKKFFLTLVFYFAAAVFYYIFVKITTLMVVKLTGYSPDLGVYKVAVQLSPGIIWGRILGAANYFYEMPLLNFNTPHGLPVVVLGLFAANTAWCAYKNKSMNLLPAIAFSGLMFILGCFILLASISPWLFSRMDSLSSRHLIAWYLFFCAASVGLIFSVIKNIFPKIRRLAPAFTMIALVVPVAAVQNKLSFLEAVVSEIEIQNMRSILGKWVEDKGFLNNRYLLVVLPVKERPAFLEESFQGRAAIGENTVLSSSKNPVQISWMVNALLREREGRPLGKSIEIVDCSFDQNCVTSTLMYSDKVALGITYGDVPIKTIENPFEINNSILTSKPVYPTIELLAIERPVLPDITASSQLENYGPQSLLAQISPGWHSERNPKYPQSITVDFHKQREIQLLGLLPQEEKTDRAPKVISIEVASDGELWEPVAGSDNACISNAAEGWHDISFAKPVKTRYLKISIFSNCGDPSLLTLKGLKIK